MTSVSGTLLGLVDLGYEILRQPNKPGDVDKVAHYATAIATLDRDKPTQSQFLSGAELLLQSLHRLMVARKFGDDQATAWEAACGALLSVVRLQAFKALHWQEDLT